MNRYPTWMIVVAILILAAPAIWLLSRAVSFLTAFGIVGVIAVAAVVWVFVWAKGRVERG
jgi:hypothetical protein